MIDVHSHILPGLDDGSPDLEESVAMVRLAAETGTTDIVATPHSDLQFTFDPAVVEALAAAHFEGQPPVRLLQTLRRSPSVKSWIEPPNADWAAARVSARP